MHVFVGMGKESLSWRLSKSQSFGSLIYIKMTNLFPDDHISFITLEEGSLSSSSTRKLLQHDVSQFSWSEVQSRLPGINDKGRTHWNPCREMVKLGVIKIIVYSSELVYGGFQWNQNISILFNIESTPKRIIQLLVINSPGISLLLVPSMYVFVTTMLHVG